MHLRLVLPILASVSSASAVAEPVGTKSAQALVEAAKLHFGIHGLKRSTAVPQESAHRGMEEVIYDDAAGGRFATYFLGAGGTLKEFIVNGPNVDTYAPAQKRRALIARMMEIAAPRSSQAERDWSAYQLDFPWSQRVRPIPVQVGDFVFRGGTTSTAKGFP